MKVVNELDIKLESWDTIKADLHGLHDQVVRSSDRGRLQGMGSWGKLFKHTPLE